MKKSFFIVLLSISCLVSFANHLKGGWIFYEYLGNGSAANTSKYKITVKQYIDCDITNPGQLDQSVYLGIFDGASNQLIQTET
ncbi:MAG: hypothetical protein ABJA71_16705, partial [Ginsengibacter sp.]